MIAGSREPRCSPWRGSPDMTFIPYARHEIDADDIAAVVAVLQGDWLTTGPIVARFEE